jgi:drug/metabolite transporter (DMT)-like permease
MDVNKKYIGLLAVFLAALCWGAAIVMSKSALGSFEPIPLLVVQLLASVLFLRLIILLMRQSPTKFSEMFKVSLLGLLEPWLTYLLVLLGMMYAQAVEAALLQSLESVAIILLAAFVFREKLTIRFIINSALVLLGLFVALEGGEAHSESSGWLGMSLTSLGMLVAAIYVVVSSKIATKQNVLHVIYRQQLVALIAAGLTWLVVGLLWKESGRVDLFSLPLATWLFAIVSGVVQYALAFCLYLFALRHISAMVAGVFLNLVPLVGIAGAVMFLDESFNYQQVVGGLVALVALIVISASPGSVDMV